MIWKINDQGQACGYENGKDLQKNKLTCKNPQVFKGALIIYPQKLKNTLNSGLDELIIQEKTK